MKTLTIKDSAKYGEQHDLFLSGVTIRCSLKGEIRIFFGNGIPPVRVRKNDPMHVQLLKQFKLGEEK